MHTHFHDELFQQKKMNKQFSQYLLHNFESSMGNLDMNKYIQIEKLPLEAITTKFIQNFISINRKNITLYSKYRHLQDLRLSQIKISSKYIEFIKSLFIVQPYISEVILRDCQLNKDFFQNLKYLHLKRLELWSCRMENNLSLFQNELKLTYLRRIVIRSDNINNKDMKIFMKLKTSFLEQIALENICVTTDIMKTLLKIDHYLKVFELSSKDAITMSISKSTTRILYHKCQIFTHYVSPRLSNDQSIYAPFYAKAKSSHNKIYLHVKGPDPVVHKHQVKADFIITPKFQEITRKYMMFYCTDKRLI